MKTKIRMLKMLPAAIVVVLGLGSSAAKATAPCGDFGECKTLIEINSADGDIGFHFLMDGDDLIYARIRDPNRKKIFSERARRSLRQQFITETFVESAEPLCFDPEDDDDPENDDEDFVTLEEFLDRWAEGTYRFIGYGADWERSLGATELTFDLPAAPTDLMFDEDTGIISWSVGEDLGECADAEELQDLVDDGVLPQHPVDVAVAAWEVVFEPDVEDGDPTGALKYAVRVAGDIAVKQVTVPADYLASLPDDTPVKIEVGAIGHEDNATFSEEGDICVNEVDGCEEEE